MKDKEKLEKAQDLIDEVIKKREEVLRDFLPLKNLVKIRIGEDMCDYVITGLVINTETLKGEVELVPRENTGGKSNIIIYI